jgi:hypothetical protein
MDLQSIPSPSKTVVLNLYPAKLNLYPAKSDYAEGQKEDLLCRNFLLIKFPAEESGQHLIQNY